MNKLQFHEIANLYPLMSEAELQTFAADIKVQGLLQAIELYEGKILDGRNRYKACLLAGVEPTVIKVDPKDPCAYVWSRNGARRHLTTSQKAMVAARMREYHEAEAKKRMSAGGGDKKSPKAKQKSGQETFPTPIFETKKPLQARDEAGAVVGVSGRTVEKATHVLEKGIPGLVALVDSGAVDVTKAVTVAQLPVAQQEAILEDAERDHWTGAEMVWAARRLLPAKPKRKKKPLSDLDAMGKVNDWLSRFLDDAPQDFRRRVYGFIKELFRARYGL